MKMKKCMASESGNLANGNLDLGSLQQSADSGIEKIGERMKLAEWPFPLDFLQSNQLRPIPLQILPQKYTLFPRGKFPCSGMSPCHVNAGEEDEEQNSATNGNE